MANLEEAIPGVARISKTAVIIDKVHSCADCPIRKSAAIQPHSIFARIHNWHKNWWPGWKAHQVKVCPISAMQNAYAHQESSQSLPV